MIVVGIDTETTGHHDASEVVEVGYCVYDVTGRIEVACGSDIFKPLLWDAYADEASGIHHITKEMTEVAGLRPEDIDLEKRILAYKPQMMISHNAEFDYPRVKRHWPKLCNIPWVCTYRDLDHSKRIKATTRRLTHLAIEYGIPVVGWHRASGDARLACMIAAEHDLVSALVRKARPRYRLKTIGPYNDHAKQELPKLGFRWQTEPDRCYVREDVFEADVPLLKKKIADIVPNWGVLEQKMPPRAY